MPNPLFSTYRAGENRVTSSTLAVFERIDLTLVQELVGAASETSGELSTVVFENQVVSSKSVPDGRISGHFTWWFETKTERNSYATEGHGRTQVREHSRLLANESDARLFVLSPDPVRPAWFGELDGVEPELRARVNWLSFRSLAKAIDSIVTNPGRLISEQTKFLLTELVALYDDDGLLTNDDTVVVAARAAWPEYLAVSAYICQPGRAFRDGLTHFGFYSQGAIQPIVPRIRAHFPTVLFSPDEAAARRAGGELELADLIDRDLAKPGIGRTEGESYGVILLTPPDHESTVLLREPIVNDTKSSSGGTWAWTLGQRYTSIERLGQASKTSDL
jgi:hypothetical protein